LLEGEGLPVRVGGSRVARPGRALYVHMLVIVAGSTFVLSDSFFILTAFGSSKIMSGGGGGRHTHHHIFGAANHTLGPLMEVLGL